jgi:Tol biopolymer transport system component
MERSIEAGTRPIASLVISAAFAGVASAGDGDGTVRVSVASDGSQANGSSGQYYADISGNGRYVVFGSVADNLDPRDHNANGENIFLRDRDPDGNGIFDEDGGTTQLVDVTLGGYAGDGGTESEDITPDGRFVVFSGACSNFVADDTNGSADVFLLDRDPDGNGIFDEGNQAIERVSLGANGVQANSYSQFCAVSADGRLIAFSSFASNLVAGDKNGRVDVFLRDRSAVTTTRVSVGLDGQEPDGDSYVPVISADGRFVAFTSLADNLIPNDTNHQNDIFLYELATGTTSLVSVATDGGGANGDSQAPRISGDGGRVVFSSTASNLFPDDGNDFVDVFMFDAATGVVSRLSETPDGVAADGESQSPVIARDGTAVLFTSEADNLIGLEVTHVASVFLRDLTAGTIEKASVRPIGEPNGTSFSYGISDDHLQVCFGSQATDLVASDTNTDTDLFVRDRTIVYPYASWSKYGDGWPGTFGVPALDATAPPVFGATTSIDVGNSLQFWTVGFILAGYARESIDSGKGGTLLVQPLVLQPFVVPTEGASLSFAVPFDASLFGMQADLQVLELDPGASHGISFSGGLELTLGQ